MGHAAVYGAVERAYVRDPLHELRTELMQRWGSIAAARRRTSDRSAHGARAEPSDARRSVEDTTHDRRAARYADNWSVPDPYEMLEYEGLARASANLNDVCSRETCQFSSRKFDEGA